MKKVLVVMVMTVMLASLLGGCMHIKIDGIGDMITGSGIIDSREESLDSKLMGVENQSSIDVILDPSLSDKAVIEGDDNLIKYVTLEQNSEGTLVVDYEPGINIMTLKAMSVRIPFVSGGTITVHGSGNIKQEGGTLNGDSFDVRVYGSGDIRLNIESPSLKLDLNGSGSAFISAASDDIIVKVDGSGDAELTGSAKTLKATQTGSGDLNGLSLKVQDANIGIHGSGSANVYVAGTLTGGINGSGSIIYDGNPGSVDVSENGSGDVRKR